ncbi:DUF378 domain-containing protein [Janthinobacterium sp. 17J80-10]|uniref:DUF378 domain-containing protein n=1 Tax=Janthinobacterium sp. 17J80-10 TaxID=2497863 RepID=UPI001F50ACCB|nr:DUF378 domain-containing protein [Janthinobacterium sp. 17J80-10]
MDTPHTERRHVPDRRAAATRGVQTTAWTSTLDWVAMALMIIGGLNWGLVGLFDFDLVAFLFGDQSLVSRVIYMAVGLASVYSLYLGSKMAGTQA